MLLIGLLVAAALALVLGIVMSSTVLLVVSIVVCGGIAALLLRARASVPAAQPDSSTGGPAVSVDVSPSASSSASSQASVWVVDGLPDYHHQGCVALAGKAEIEVPQSQAVE